ncbi:MAG: hypothetical protein AAED33_02065 [Paracoccaceae bacterium]
MTARAFGVDLTGCEADLIGVSCENIPDNLCSLTLEYKTKQPFLMTTTLI